MRRVLVRIHSLAVAKISATRLKTSGHSQKYKRLAPTRAPDLEEDSARQRCLCGRVDVPDVVAVKNFLCFCFATSHGKIEGSTGDLVNTFTGWFFTDSTWIMGTATDEKDSLQLRCS
jgi:hypothetical protein